MPPVRVVTVAAVVVAMVVAALLAGSSLHAASEAGTGGAEAAAFGSGSQSATGRFYLTPAEIERMRRNVATREWARAAWDRTRGEADGALDDVPQPADPKKDYSEKGPDPCDGSTEGWFCGLYQPGLADGHKTHRLALAYAVTGEARYGEKAKEFLLAWARGYTPPAERIGHAVAEPVGFMLKAFLAYDVVQDVFTAQERDWMRSWARQFVERGKRQADHARDRPWVPEAPYGNSATWARLLAVSAAAVAGEPVLSETLAWNWAHTTSGGKDYGWEHLLDGAIAPNGQLFEERVRGSIGYALYTWYPLAFIAHIARRAGFEPDLWTAETSSGKSLLLPIDYYAPYLTEEKGDPYAGSTGCCYAPYETVLPEYRAAMELAYNALPDSAVLRRIVTHGGDAVRGANEDPHITRWNALTGELTGG